MKLTISYNPDTDLLELKSSGGELSLSQTEVGALYIVLRKALGFKGRFRLFMHRRKFALI